MRDRRVLRAVSLSAYSCACARARMHASGIVKSLRRRRKREQAGTSLAGGLGQGNPDMAACGTIVLAGGGACLCWP